MNIGRVFPSPAPPAAREPRIDLIFFDAGGGHRASATALKELADRQRRGWQLRMVNLREILEPIDVFHRLTGVRVEDLYNRMLKYGLTIGTGPMLRAVQFLIRRMHPRNVALLAQYWRENRPDLVVSMIPNFNRAIFEGLRIADRESLRPATPMVTILTDLADCPPHFWIERQEQYLICGTARAAEQALAAGYPPRRVLRTSGMIVRPEFYDRQELSREQERGRLGLGAELPTGLVMFGGFGSRRMLTIARRVAESGIKTQMIFLCGHNQRLRAQLLAMKLPFPCYIEGFTRDIPRLMRLSDYFIGKPGPGSVSEALVMGLPVIVERNARTMVQERYNTEWIERNEFGVVLRSFSEIAAGVARMLDSRGFAHFRARAAASNNRAVFEIPDLLDALIAAARPEAETVAALRALA
jgi:hypothetical protein